MTSRVAVVVIDALDVEVVAAFWCQVLSYDVVERDEGVVSIAGDHGSAIDVPPVAEAKAAKKTVATGPARR